MWLFTLTAVILAIATLLPISSSRQWWVRACDFPRVQIALLLLAWLMVWVLAAFASQSPSVWLAAAMLACLIYQCRWIRPNTTAHAIELQTADDTQINVKPHVSLLNCNVLMTNRDAGKLLDLVEQYEPDILITLESDQWWQDKLDTLGSYPHRVACPLDNLYGMHVYSKLPLDDARIDYLVESDIPSIGANIRLTDDSHVRLHVLHPTPPAPGENTRSTERDVELMVLAKALEGSSKRIIVVGDLNDVAWSRSTRLFRRITGLLDPRTGRGMFNTYHADHWFARWPLDHVFTSSHFRLMQLERLPHVGSDHFPMFVKLLVSEPEALESHPVREDADEQQLEELMETSVAKKADSPTIS